MTVDTYTPILWATLSEEERYEEYIRWRAALDVLLIILSTFRVGMPCQETTGYDETCNDYTRCNQPSIGIVWHEKDRRAYPMCRLCLSHNTDNRGGIQIR